MSDPGWHGAPAVHPMSMTVTSTITMMMVIADNACSPAITRASFNVGDYAS